MWRSFTDRVQSVPVALGRDRSDRAAVKEHAALDINAQAGPGSERI